MHELDILVGQIQRKQEYESMGMVQALKTMAEKITNLITVSSMIKAATFFLL